MASRFLENMAKKRESVLSSQSEQKSEARTGIASDFLRNKANERNAALLLEETTIERKPIGNGYASVADLNRSTNGSGVYSASGALQKAARELTATLPESRPARTSRTYWDGTTRERNDRGTMLREAIGKKYDTEGSIESGVDRALAILSGAGAAAVRGLSAVDSAASEDRKRTENALRNLETYTANRDAATTDAERDRWQKLADAAQRQIDAYSGAAETKRQNAQDAAAALETTRDNLLRAASEGDYNARAGRALETIDKYGDNRYSDNLGGLVGSNYAVGRLSQNSAYAWDEYLNSPTEKNKKIAQTYDLALRNNSENNADALEANGGFQTLIKSAAGYVPQLMDQTAARLKGGAVGLLAGNANAGQAAGAAADMYRITRGAAFRELLNAGIPEEQARAMAKDEAFVSSLIEYADSAAEFAVFGGQNIVRLLLSNGAEAAGTQAGKSAARNALKKLAAYLGNIPQEYAEEYAQEGVSIANENRYSSGTTGSGIFGLARDAVGTIFGEQDAEKRRQMQEAGNEGARIAALFGLLEAGGGYAAEREVNRRSVDVGAEAISDALNEARTNGAISDAAAGAVLQNEPVMNLLTRMGEVELTDNMDRAQRTDAVRDALTRLAESVVAREEEQPTVEAAAEAGAQRRENQPQTLPEKQFGLRDVSEAQLARDIRTARESFAPTLGREGARAFANRYNEDAARLIAPDEAFKGFNQVYSAALMGEELPEVNIPNSLAYAAQLAGESDRRTAAQAKYFGENAGLAKNRSGAPRNLSSADARLLDSFGKATGTQIGFADSIVGRDERGTFTSNAKIENGRLTLAKDAEDPLRVSSVHEITHRVREVSPEAYSAMSRFVLDNMSDERFSSALRERMERYGSTDISDVSEELVADAYGTILGDSELLDRFAGTNRSAAQRILDAIRDIIVKIRRALSGGSQAMLTEDQKEAFRDLQGREEEMARLLEDALERTRERAQENENAATAGGGARYSRKAEVLALEGVDWMEDNSSIKQQLQKHADEINAMEPVAVVTYNGIAKEKLANRIMAEVPRIGGGRIVKGGISFEFDKKGAEKIASHARGNELGAAALAAPYVAKYGRLVAGQKNHENTGLTTLTYAAPVIINGDTVNVGVVIQFQADGSPRAVNVGLQSNGNFKINMKKALKGSDSRVDRYGQGTALPTMSASADSVTASDAKSKPQNGERRDSRKRGDMAQREAQLLRENDILRQQVDALRGEMRRSDPAGRIDPKNVRKAARELIDYYGSTVKADEIADDMQRLYDLMGTGGTEESELSYDAAREIADTVARKIAENALDDTGSLYADYEELRKFLRDADIIVTAEDTRNITDWNDWRKARMGKIKIKRGETSNIDVVYDELSERWPEFFPGDVLSVEDQIQHMADVADNIYADRGRNPYDPYMDQAVIGIGNDIMERFFDLPQYKTFADRQAEKIESMRVKMSDLNQQHKETMQRGLERVRQNRDKQVAKQKEKNVELRGKIDALREKMSALRQTHKEDMQRSLARVRQNRDERLAKQRDRFKAKTEAGRQKQRAAVLRKRIERHAAALDQRLRHGTDNKNVPDDLRNPVLALLSSINQESTYDYQVGYEGAVNPKTGKIIGDAKRVPRGEGNIETERTQAFQALKEQYQKALAESDGNMVIDPDLIGEQGSGFQGLFDQVLSFGDTPIRSMNEEQLSTIWKVLRSVEHSITTYGKLMAVQKYKTTEHLAKRFYDETASRRDRSSLRGLDPALDLENPYTFFSQYGEAGKAIYRMLRDAQDGQRRKLDEVIRLTQSAVDSETVDKLRKERHEITTSLRDHLTLTTSQLMEIYLLSKREQALNHLVKGGIVQPEIAKDGKQPRIPRGNQTIRLSLNDLEKMIGLLTPEQIRIADALQAITTDVLAVWGNEAAMQAYGYRKFTEPNYWPIKSASEVLHSNVEKDGGNVRSIKNIGMAKAVIPQASNAVNVNDVFDTFAGHTADMLDYSTWLLPMEDAQRFFNFKFKDEEGNTKTTVKFQLDRVGGANGKASRYWMNLMSDVQNGIDHGRGSDTERLVNRIVGNTKGAAVGANLRVVIQQPTAFFRAGAVMDPASLTKGLFSGVTGGNAWEKAQQWSGIARIKEAGGFDQGSRRSIGNELYDDRSRIEKLNDAAGWLAGRADTVTWGRLWNAAEWETKRIYPDLPNGCTDFYQKAAEIFTDTIDQTQVVDGVLQRSAIMRSGDRLTQQMTSFMGEPIMSLNMLLRAWDNVRYEDIPKRRSAAIKTMGRSVLALLVTDAVNALAQSLVDAMRDDDKDKDYGEKLLAALSGIEGDEETAAQYLKNVYFGSNFVQNINPLNRLPVLKDAQSLMQGFSVERLDASTISDIIQAHNRLLSGKVTPGYGVYRLIGTVAKLAGIPVVNLERDVLSVVRSAVYATDNYSAMYDLERAIYTPSANVSRFYDVLTLALRDGDADSYQALRERMAEDSGKSSKDIDAAVKSRLTKGGWMNPQAAEVLGVVDKYAEKQEDEDKFSAESLDPAAYTRYNNQRAAAFKELRGGLEATKEFKALSDADKDKAIGWAKSFADHKALADNSGGQYQIDTKWEKAALDAERAGIGAGVYLLFHTVYETTSDTKDADGKKIKGQEKKDKMRAWLESQHGLTNGQREWLWGTEYSTEW